MKTLVLKLVASVFIVSGLIAPKAIAEGNTISVSPAKIDMRLARDDIEKVSTVTIKNSFNVPVMISVELQGYDAESGRLIPNGQSIGELAKNIRLSAQDITIAENSSGFIKLTVSAESLAPGGHYATLVLTQTRAGSKEVSLNQSLSIGLFIVKEGGQDRTITPTLFKLKTLPFQLPTSAQVTLLNDGNVHIVPRASVVVYGRNQEILSRGVFNQESKIILPGKSFTGSAKLTQVKNLWLPQRVTFALEYRGDDIEEISQRATSHLYIPTRFVFLVAVGTISLMYMLWRRKKPKKLRNKKHNNKPQAVEDIPLPEERESEETVITVRRIKHHK